MGKIVDITEQRFGKYLVLKEIGRDKGGNVLWKCLCDCGTIKTVRGYDLRNGKVRSCGCWQKELASKANKVNLIGQRFARCLVLEEAGKDRWGHINWKCLCDCGNIVIIGGKRLRSGHTRSCGCLQRERASKANIGINHHNYNSNLTDEERKRKRKYPKYKEWCKEVLKRDNYTCQCCNKYGGKLAVHHLESYNSNFKLRTVFKNGITLCKKCHRKFHNQYGYGNNTKEQFEWFLYSRKIYN